MGRGQLRLSLFFRMILMCGYRKVCSSLPVPSLLKPPTPLTPQSRFSPTTPTLLSASATSSSTFTSPPPPPPPLRPSSQPAPASPMLKTLDLGSRTIVTEPELTALAKRDRAYGLLNTLTKLKNGWDCSEAWFALATAYEKGNQFDKARECLWWCVRLEDTRPVRGWSRVGVYVL
jgi:cargo-transport protein YPP1